MEAIRVNRKRFLAVAGGAALFIVSKGLARTSMEKNRVNTKILPLQTDEIEILHLASLAPSGHNTQPWFVKYINHGHYILCSDKTRWLPAVDPNQRETVLSLGAFLQNLEYAAQSYGYSSKISLLAQTNQDEEMADVKLVKSGSVHGSDVSKLKNRRVLRSNFLSDPLNQDDVQFLIHGENEFIHFYPRSSKEHSWLNEITIEANQVQAYREDAQKELAHWIRFSTKDAHQHKDGLTTATMEIGGVSGWILRNFYSEGNVMKQNFRKRTVETVRLQVSQSGGWLVISSKDNSVASLIETGKRFQRMLLKARERNIAIHPMTQILEEPSTNQHINKALGIEKPIQFLLRVGYVKEYPLPVSLRREVKDFVRI